MTNRKMRHGLLGIVLGWAVLGVGCGKVTEQEKATPGATVNPSLHANPSANADVAASSGPAARVSARPPDTEGKVFIAEYHHLGDSKDSMFRSAAKFRGDLDRLYRMGFRPQTVSDYIDNRMVLAPGASPVVFTFDDSNPDQVKLSPDGKLAPDCFLGIWQEFARTHPEFPIRATFYVLPDTMWGQPKMLAQKLALLKTLGCELANHTMTHPKLRGLSDERVKFEIGEAQKRLVALGVPMPATLALPFGQSPRNRGLLAGFDYQGARIVPKAVMLVGAEPARAPTDPKLNRLRIPRIQAYDGPYGLTYWLDQVDRERVHLYVAP